MELCYTGFEVISNDRLSLITDSPNQYSYENIHWKIEKNI